MGLSVPRKLSSVTLYCTEGSTDKVKRPFYVMDLSVQHGVGFTPIYYVGGSWPNYERKVWFQPKSGGGSITLTGFFNTTANYNETFNYLANSVQINPVTGTPLAQLADLDLRINGKKFKKCYCVAHQLRSQTVGGANIIYGTISYIFSTIESYPSNI